MNLYEVKTPEGVIIKIRTGSGMDDAVRKASELRGLPGEAEYHVTDMSSRSRYTVNCYSSMKFYTNIQEVLEVHNG